MHHDLLFWTYFVNAVLLINHEIDSAYWQEWKLFNPYDNSDDKGFVLIHIPMVFIILYGLIVLEQGSIVAYIISFILALSGVFAFFFHFYYLHKGRTEFNTWVSKALLITILPVSIVQLTLTAETVFMIATF